MIDQAEQEGIDQEQEQPQDLVVDILTGKELKPTEKEEILQRMIRVLAGEYHFPLECMRRDVAIPVELDGRKRTRYADLVVFAPDGPHTLDRAERLVVAQPPSVKPSDGTRGLELLKDLLDAAPGCEFGLWTNGKDIAYVRKRAVPSNPPSTSCRTSPARARRWRSWIARIGGSPAWPWRRICATPCCAATIISTATRG